jgi:hypothetical protein
MKWHYYLIMVEPLLMAFATGTLHKDFSPIGVDSYVHHIFQGSDTFYFYLLPKAIWLIFAEKYPH